MIRRKQYIGLFLTFKDTGPFKFHSLRIPSLFLREKHGVRKGEHLLINVSDSPNGE